MMIIRESCGMKQAPPGSIPGDFRRIQGQRKDARWCLGLVGRLWRLTGDGDVVRACGIGDERENRYFGCPRSFVVVGSVFNRVAFTVKHAREPGVRQCTEAGAFAPDLKTVGQVFFQFHCKPVDVARSLPQ